jgi:hypothetical protein
VAVTPSPLEIVFPDLDRSGYRITSPATQAYNCIAWAAGDTENWWWPGPLGESFWPQSVPRHETLDAFVAAYATLGFERCESGTFAPGFEKLALYVDAQGKPTHAARQLEDGTWTSKLGTEEDIAHVAVDALEGALYGRIACFLVRPRG